MTPSSDLSTRIAVTIREQQLFSPGDTLVIGLSGGADSTALLDLLSSLPGTPLRLIAAHLNHCLRGAESDADEEFCRRLAVQYHIPFATRRVDVRAIADNGALNLEDAGRRARIALFDELLTTWQATAVVLAHHADDQAETVLMRLLRGSGMTGLAGMPFRNGRGYVRPLLDISRAEIEAHLINRGLTWREDGSNLDRSFLRNRIRHELLPLLEQYNPSIRASLATTATILSAENELLDELAAQAAGQICHETAHGPSCSIHLLTEQPQTLQRRIVRLLLSRLHGNLEQLGFLHVDAICRMVVSPRPNSMISLPHDIIAVKEYDELVFRTGAQMTHKQTELFIPGPGIYQLPGGALLTVEISQLPAHLDMIGSSTVYFDLDNVPFPWHVRTFLPGDRIQQFGMIGRKKVKNIFIDNKIPVTQRRLIPLLFCGDELIWLCGLRCSQRARLDSRTVHIVKVEYSRTNGLASSQLTCI